MSINSKLFEMTQLAEASYTRFRQASVSDAAESTKDLKDKDNTGGEFSASQATEFVKSWRLVAHQGNTGSGFSASVFERIDPTSGAGTGTYTLSCRGTETGQQLGIDLFVADVAQLVKDGAAFDQIIDLYNFMQRVTHAQGDPIKQAYRIDGTTLPENGLFLTTVNASTGISTYSSVAFESVTNAKPSGEATLTTSTVFDATGHSLGGHLAASFSRLFPQNAGSVFTVNGAGERDTTEAKRFYDALAERTGTTFDASKITRIVGSAGFDIVSGSAVYTQTGAEVRAYTEAAGVGEVGGHGGGQVTDSMAVFDLFLKADDSLRTKSPADVAKILRPIFDSASNEPTSVASGLGSSTGTTLEKLVGTMYRLFVDEKNDAQTAKREELFMQIGSIRAALNGTLRIVDLSEMDAKSLLSKAQSGLDAIAYRWSLKEGIPFAVLGADYSALPSLDLYDPTSGTGTITDTWLKTRAEYLHWRLKGNAQDANNIKGKHGAENTEYLDPAYILPLEVKGQVLGYDSAAGSWGHVLHFAFNLRQTPRMVDHYALNLPASSPCGLPWQWPKDLARRPLAKPYEAKCLVSAPGSK